MATRRVYQFPDGHVEVFSAGDGDFAAAMARAEAAYPRLKGLPFADVDEDALPPRDRRDAWRIQNGALTVDAAVPAPVDPEKQANRQAHQAMQTARAALVAASTPAEIKAALILHTDAIRLWMASRPGNG